MQAFVHKGQTYYWKDHRWMDNQYLTVEARLSRELDQTFPRPPMGPRQVANIRAEARVKGQRSVLYSAGVPDLQNAASVAVYSGLYRDQGQPKMALSLTESWKYSSDPYVLVARSAALCDLDRWREARNVAQRALELGGGFAACRVLGRIRREEYGV